MTRKVGIILGCLIGANIIAFAPHLPLAPAHAVEQAMMLPAPEPAGIGHWSSINDIDMDTASRLSPATITAIYSYGNGAQAVIHRLGEQYYRIYSLSGNVYYEVWFEAK